MANDFKLMITGIVITFLLIVGISFVFGDRQQKEEAVIASTKIEGLEAKPEIYDLGSVPLNGGLVIKEYEVTNTTSSVLKLKKIATSCMCTKAKVKIGDKETKFFGMEGHGDKNAPVNLEIAVDEVAKVTMEFDPAAHGPQGVGPIDRSIFLTFSDPVGMKELGFKGVVVNN
jgi:hypothetical protein